MGCQEVGINFRYSWKELIGQLQIERALNGNKMKIIEMFTSDRSRIYLIGTAVLLILLPPLFSILFSSRYSSDESSTGFLEMPDAKYKQCVRDKAYMRIHHMDYLKEIREQFVRYGERGDISLSTCSGCHTSRDQFCDRCHSAVNLNLDCFGCHYYPESNRQEAAAGVTKWTDVNS